MTTCATCRGSIAPDTSCTTCALLAPAPSVLPQILVGLGVAAIGGAMAAGVISAPIASLPYALIGSGLGLMIARPKAKTRAAT